MKKVKLPDTINVSYHTLKITLLDPTVALEVGDQQGSYDAVSYTHLRAHET